MVDKTVQNEPNGAAESKPSDPKAADSEDTVTEKQPEKQNEAKKTSRLKQLWQKAGLDAMTLSLMFKGSLPPIIGIAMFQSTAVQDHYGTIGYLIAISSVLGFSIMPRGKFIQNMTLNVITICFATAINLLALYCVTQARLNTTPPTADPTVVLYNSSASTVAAIWLIIQIYTVNVLRAARPQFQFPAILCSIFVSVSLTYGVMFPNMDYAITFMEQLLEAFLTGFALATAVYFVVFPLSSRTVVFKEMTGYLMLLGGCLKSQTAYMASLETIDPVQIKEQREAEEGKKSKHKKPEHHPTIMETPALVKLRETQEKLLELHGKLNGDVTPAKREFAFGKLESHDITLLWKQLQQIFLPVMGLMSMINIVERQAELLGWADKDGTPEELEARHFQLNNVRVLAKELHEPFSSMTATLDGAFQHILLTLGFVKPPKKKKPDEESVGGQSPLPGSPGFADAFKKRVDDFYSSKQQTLRDWAHDHGIDLPEDFFESSFVCPENVEIKDEPVREQYQRQLFFILYLEYLLGRVCASVLDLVVFVDQRKQSGVLDRSKVIFPGSKTLYKWLKGVIGREDLSEEDSYTVDFDSGAAKSMYLGDQFFRKPDPEHLPPVNTTERIGNAIRQIPRFFRSQASMFGLRVTAATMTIAILCYLSDTQRFFLENRLLWAMIMVAISMSTTAGQSIFNFILRIFGTFIAMVGAYIIWYIVDGRIPGVIVFLWLWIFLAFYFVLKFPKFVIVAILSLVTAILIVGYEIQVKTIGVTISEQNGQPAYPTYQLAPYRLATVAGGLFITFIWTMFPFPVSESSELRKDISASLYLLSSFYSAVHETIKIRVQNTERSANAKGAHAYNLEKARLAMFSKLILLATSLQTNSAFSKFQIRIGGRFPREDYEELMLWTSLASYASTSLQTDSSSDAATPTWSSNFRQLLLNASVTSNKITSLLSLLSSSLSNAQPLPPYLDLPEPFQLLKRLESMNRDVLSIRHFAEPEYSVFAVMQVVSQSINGEISLLVKLVKKLVGENDFSFSSFKSSSNTLSTDSDDDKSKAD